MCYSVCLENTILELTACFQIEAVKDREFSQRQQLTDLGLKQTERLKLSNENKNEEDDEYECQICNANLYVSLVRNVFVCSKRFLSYCVCEIEFIAPLIMKYQIHTAM